MTPVTSFSGQAVALFGLGGSGLATARALTAGGAKVSAWDDGEASRAAALAEGVPVVDLHSADWTEFSALVLSPGVPLTHPEPHWAAVMAQDANVPVIGDIELFFRERRAVSPGAPVIAITGTNGKSTTTALIAHLLSVAGRTVQMGGNIGTAALSLAPPSLDHVHVLELSSFQIDLAPTLDPTIGVQLNLTPDHLDRHGSMEAYGAIKERLVASSSFAVIGVDDAYSAAMAGRSEAQGRATIRISAEGALKRGVYAEGSKIYFSRGEDPRLVADLAGIGSLRGQHNAQNVCAAVSAALLTGIDADTILRGLQSFPGLPHRMEQVGMVGQVLFINDSKATNADSTEKALSAFERSVFWIVGGKPKEGGIEALEPYFERVSRAYLIGESSTVFAKTLEGKVAFERCETLQRATEAANMDAALHMGGNPVVLLSPACASYDQFKNFEERGNAFRQQVQRLAGFTPIANPTAKQVRHDFPR
jgi:UDP-N-acetylmuramoylalanine--D-glutamate ligase